MDGFVLHARQIATASAACNDGNREGEVRMTITLWGRLNSANVQKAVWALEELALLYEHVPAGGSFGGLDSPDFLAMNPNGRVPVLRDGDLTLWESHAVVRYLSAEYGSGLLFPLEPVDRAPVDQWTDWVATTFQPAWMNVFWDLVRTPTPQHDKARIARGIATSIHCFEMMERRLADMPYLGGRDFTYADIVAGVAMYRWTTMPIDRPALPALAAWHERLLERPAFHKAVCLPYDELVGRLAF
jgi:glutathione S-transferase